MRPETRTYWRDPGYWRWWFRTRVPTETKVLLALLAAIVIVVSGFVSAGKLDGTEVSTLTVVRTTRVAGKPPQVVTEVQTISGPVERPGAPRQRNGRTIVVQAPGETVTQSRTVRGPDGHRVVTNELTDTVTRTVRRDGLRTVTAPGSTLPGPERVVTAPGTTQFETVIREVTLPAKTVTETEAAKTVTKETTVTNERTVTNEVTVTETVQETVTETVQETVTETVKCNGRC